MRPGLLPRKAAATVWLLVALGGCGKSASGSASSDALAYLYEHNARENGGRTTRWAARPIPVFLSGLGREDEVTVWTGVSGGRVTFQVVGAAPSNGIELRAGQPGPRACGGHRTVFRGSGQIVSSVIILDTGIYRGPGCVRTVTHEVGHAIGFFIHTADGGLMDDNGGNGVVTEAVAEAIRTLYSLAPGTLVGPAESLQLVRPGSAGLHTVTSVQPMR